MEFRVPSHPGRLQKHDFHVASCGVCGVLWLAADRVDNCQCFFAGGCRPGCLRRRMWRPRYPVGPVGGDQRGFLPWMGNPLLSSKLGCLQRCHVCPRVGLEAVGQLLCPLLPHKSPGPRPAHSPPVLLRSCCSLQDRGRAQCSPCLACVRPEGLEWVSHLWLLPLPLSLSLLCDTEVPYD